MDAVEFRCLIIKYRDIPRIFSKKQKGALEEILQCARNNRELVPLLKDLEDVPEAQQLLQTTLRATYEILKVLSSKPSFHTVFEYDGTVKVYFVDSVWRSLENNDEARAGKIPQVYLDCADELGGSMLHMINKFRGKLEQEEVERQKVIAAQVVISNPSSLSEYLEAVRTLGVTPNLFVVSDLLHKMLSNPSVSCENLISVYRMLVSVRYYGSAQSENLETTLRQAMRVRARTEREKVSLYHLLREHSDAHGYMEFLFERGDDMVAIYHAVQNNLHERRPEAVRAVDLSLAYWTHRCALRDSYVKQQPT